MLSQINPIFGVVGIVRALKVKIHLITYLVGKLGKAGIGVDL